MLPETVMCVTDGQVTRKRTFPTAFNNLMPNAGLKILQNIIRKNFTGFVKLS